MGTTGIDTSYEPFSDRPEYLELNRGFIADLELEGANTFLDLACGTGNLSAEIFKRSPEAEVIGVDICRESLYIARKRAGGRGENDDSAEQASLTRSLFLVEGSADHIPLDENCVDAVVMGNAIHNLPDLDLLLDEVHRVLRPSGIFAFNTSFYAGTFAPGTDRFYLQWMKDALRFVQAADQASKAQGKEGVQRTRGSRPRSADNPWLSADQYLEALERHRFRVLPTNEREVQMSRESFESVGSYAGLASVLLSGYPVELACQALETTAKSALAAVDMASVPRLWLEVAAEKN